MPHRSRVSAIWAHDFSGSKGRPERILCQAFECVQQHLHREHAYFLRFFSSGNHRCPVKSTRSMHRGIGIGGERNVGFNSYRMDAHR